MNTTVRDNKLVSVRNRFGRQNEKSITINHLGGCTYIHLHNSRNNKRITLGIDELKELNEMLLDRLGRIDRRFKQENAGHFEDKDLAAALLRSDEDLAAAMLSRDEDLAAAMLPNDENLAVVLLPSDEDLATAQLGSDEDPATALLPSDEDLATAQLCSDEDPAAAQHCTNESLVAAQLGVLFKKCELAAKQKTRKAKRDHGLSKLRPRIQKRLSRKAGKRPIKCPWIYSYDNKD